MGAYQTGDRALIGRKRENLAYPGSTALPGLGADIIQVLIEYRGRPSNRHDLGKPRDIQLTRRHMMKSPVSPVEAKIL